MTQTFSKPQSVGAALQLMAEGGETARALSGGATLVAMMNANLVESDRLISLAGIAELREHSRANDGTVRIGAMRRHRETAFETDLRDGQQVLSRAAANIANVPVRNMGTLGGSISFADPAADYPPALVAADARVEIAGPSGRREVPAEEFFLGWYETALQPGELVTAVLVPPAAEGSCGVYEKLNRIAGDFAIASIALSVQLDGDTIKQVRLAVGGCGGGPIRVQAAEEQLVGNPVSQDNAHQAGKLLIAELDPIDDVRASADYRRRVVPRMLTKALHQAQIFTTEAMR